MSLDAPPPTGVIHRIALFIEGLKRAMAEGIRPREYTLAAMAVPLWNYLTLTLRRLAALHARFDAGTLAPAPVHSRACAWHPTARSECAGCRPFRPDRCWRTIG